MSADGRLTADHIKRVLARKYADTNHWLYLTEVRTTTGWGYRGGAAGKERYLDAFAISLWATDRYLRVAYEIKVDRTDFLRELAEPRKRMHAHFLSHTAWFVVAPGVVRLHREDERGRWEKGDDLHDLDGWGVLEVDAAGNERVLQRAEQRVAWPMPDGFIASLARRAFQAGMGVRPTELLFGPAEPASARTPPAKGLPLPLAPLPA